MMIRLVAAQLWRLRWQCLLLMLLGAGSVSTASDPTSFTARYSQAMPMLLSWAAISTIGIFWARDVRILPISRRAALRSAWLSALVLPIAIMTGRSVGVLIHLAFGSTATLGVEAIGLAVVRDTLYIGINLANMQRDDEPWHSVRQTLSSLRKSGRLVMTLLWMMAVPFVGPEVTPTSLADVTWLHLAAVVVGTVIGLWPLIATPDQWPRLGILYDAPRTRASRPARPERASQTLDALKGMRRLLPEPVGTAALVAVLALGAGMALTFSLRSVQGPFGAGLPDMEFFLIGGPFFLLILSPFSWANGITPFLRPLRVLPVTAMTLVATITAVPLMMPVFFWTLAAAGHLAVGAPDDASWRLESFALICGVMAFSGAVHARFNSILTLMAGAALPLIGVLALMAFFNKTTVEPVIAFWFPVIGLVGVPAAFLLNYRTVTRASSSSAAYRPVLGKSLHRGGV